MLAKSNPQYEKEQIERLSSSEPELLQQHHIFLAEMEFKQQLIDMRKRRAVTQKEISQKSGLSQQAVSRLEKGHGGTLETVFRYLDAMGCTLAVRDK